MPKYCVPVHYRGVSNYIVEADSPEKAEEKAKAAYHEGQTPDLLGNEFEQIEKIGDVEVVP